MSVAIEIVLVLVVPWLVVFGGMGFLLARQRGAQSWTGVAAGCLFGPVGWLGLLRMTRASRQADPEPWRAEDRAATAQAPEGGAGGHRF